MEFRPVHKGFGVEVLHFDMLNARSPEEIDALRKAFDKHQLLLFRCGGQRLPPERQVEISSWFGPLIANGDDGGQWTVLHNENLAGSMRLPFHCDFSYTDSPCSGISLHAVELPPDGATTAFVSSVDAWARLTPGEQSKLRTLTLHHRHLSKAVSVLPEFNADHPVRLEHPRTGEPLLFVTEYHAHRILELEPAESDRLIAQLFAHLYAGEHVYVHRWELNDLIVWDNLAVQHARPQAAEPGDGARAMQRVALGEASFAELVERAKQNASRL
jgi:taurine dioxygenase